ncbi:aminotransferase class V-fold PLP-dependent enzyme [Curtobacterium sp. 9128]|uniref:aminotransferase class V-fold PLP-dependent enzyme n=1 Tax=Curtobacterium sp. 9128 TaxID=1793722 RepID=UPI00119EA1CE|nr:aminotransferase class V-fold PLP-dependent enzyme [Curtobacterium sp. 9128]
MDSFVDGHGYLAACTAGLPTRGTLAAQRADLDAWGTGASSPVGYGALVEEGRGLFAQVVGVPAERVATGSQTSVMTAVVAASLPDGAEVVVPEGDFSSIVFPFLAQAHRGVRVRSVPLDALTSSLAPDTALVAWSAVQSATGVVADSTAVVDAAHAVGARTLCDLTQAAGVLPVSAEPFDVTVTHAYKWLCAPRGVAFMTLSEAALGWLRPVQAGWYAGADVWSSCYGPAMRLADDARRFDVSPAWQAWPGAVAALRHIASLDPASAWRHATGLADRLADRLGVARQSQAVMTVPDPSGAQLAALTAAGITASGRAGRLRLAFHHWNDESDVDAVAAVLAR